MKTAIDTILAQLNEAVIFIKFHQQQEDQFVLFANYFSYRISFKVISYYSGELPPVQFNAIFAISIQKDIISKEFGLQSIEILPSIKIEGLPAAIKYINDFIKLLPFTILKHQKGQYLLLDPEGYDYVGEYITLKDAKKTCCQNFTM